MIIRVCDTEERSCFTKFCFLHRYEIFNLSLQLHEHSYMIKNSIILVLLYAICIENNTYNFIPITYLSFCLRTVHVLRYCVRSRLLLWFLKIRRASFRFVCYKLYIHLIAENVSNKIYQFYCSPLSTKFK